MPFGGLLVAGISGATSILGGLLGSSASSRAAKIQEENAQKVAGMATAAGTSAQADVSNAKANLKDIYGQESSNLQPYLAAGKQGITTLADLLKPGGQLTQQFQFDSSKIAQDPGYQFQLQQGQEALQRSAAARGQALGGGTMKSLLGYAQGLAGTEFQNAYNRSLTTFQTNRNNTLQSLGLLTGFGQTATGQFNNAGQNYGGQFLGGAEAQGQFGLSAADIAGRALTGGANASAAGQVGQANSWNSALGGISNAGQYYNLSQILGQNGGGGYQYNPTTFVPPNASNSSAMAPVNTALPPPPSINNYLGQGGGPVF